MNSFKRAFLIVCTLALAACATNQFSKTQAPVAGITLKNPKIFIYSFLDIRDAEFGPNMLKEFDTQLVNTLKQADATAKVLRFKDSEPGKYFAITSGGVQVPIRETIERNLENERSMGAEYRLIIFPSKITLSGAWRIYDVKWDLFSVKTGTIVWSTTSQGKHMNAWKNDEEPTARAKTIVDGIIGEMIGSKLL
jgi:hypothetical protein